MKFIPIILLLINSTISYSQNVGIGTNSPHPSATLEIQDTSRGILIPRMNMAQRTAIQNPAEGLMVYQTDSTKGFWYWDGLVWQNIKSNMSNEYSNNGINMLVFTPGVYSWIVPNGVESVIIEIWGAGGGGGVGSYTNCGGTGGAGGYGKGPVQVVPGETITINVGYGGNACTTNWPGPCNGGNGGTTSFKSISASGGTGGIGNLSGNWSSNNPGANGISGTCNALLNCSSSTNVPCANLLGIQYGKGGSGNCTTSGGSFSSQSGNEGFLILTY